MEDTTKITRELGVSPKAALQRTLEGRLNALGHVPNEHGALRDYVLATIVELGQNFTQLIGNGHSFNGNNGSHSNGTNGHDVGSLVELNGDGHGNRQHITGIPEALGSEDSVLLYPFQYEVYVKNETGLKHVHLTPTEFKLLQYFMINTGRVLSYDDIHQSVLGNDRPVGNSTIKGYIRRLREKLGIRAIVAALGGYKCTIPNLNGSNTETDETSNKPNKKLSIQDLLIDTEGHEVYKNGEKVNLTLTEYTILIRLVEEHGRIVTKQQLANSLRHDSEVLGSDSTLVKKYIQRIRQKLGDNASNPKYIEAVPGFGYKLRMGSNQTQYQSNLFPK